MEEEDERNVLREEDNHKRSRTMAAVIASKDANTPLDGSCLTPLMKVCQTESDETLKLVDVLLAAGADPNLRTNDGNTCLHFAAKFSSATVVQRLVEIGANITVENDVGATPLAEACRRVDPDAKLIIGILVTEAKRINNYSGFSLAIAIACRYSIFDVLIELKKANVFKSAVTKFRFNCSVVGRSTCLMAACCNRFDGARIIEFLVRLPGVDVNFANDDYSVLRVACEHGNGEIVRALLCAFPKKSEWFDYLWVARNRADSLGVLKALYAYNKRYCSNAYEDLKGVVTEDAIWAFGHFGMRKRNSYSVQQQYLLQFASLARFGKVDNVGSFLHVAAANGDLYRVQSLMKQNASPFFTDIRKKLPIEVAANEEIRLVLMEYMQWKPKREIQLWFGPSFQKRVWTLLLLLKRLQPRIGWVPRDIRNLLVQYVAKMEPVSTPWKRYRSKKK